MAVITISIPEGKYLAVLGTPERAEKVIIGDTVDEVFRETRVKDRTSRILYEDKIFKTYGSDVFG